MIKINIINNSKNELPKYETEYAAGMDLRANLNESIVLDPLKRIIIPTGIFIALPVGYEAQIRPRSGLAAKYGVTILNTPGTIDCDYRGEIKIILINLGDTAFVINNNDRIAQMVINKYETVKLNQVVVFDVQTVRGDSGFGHTGTQ